MPKFKSNNRMMIYLSNNLTPETIEQQAQLQNKTKSKYICDLILKDIETTKTNENNRNTD